MLPGGVIALRGLWRYRLEAQARTGYMGESFGARRFGTWGQMLGHCGKSHVE